jgi:hypothetical protein
VNLSIGIGLVPAGSLISWQQIIHRVPGTRPPSAPAADASEFLFEIIVGLFHRPIGRAPFLNTLHILDSRLPMTCLGLRNIALAFATTLRIRGGQNDLQTQPRAM